MTFLSLSNASSTGSPPVLQEATKLTWRLLWKWGAKQEGVFLLALSLGLLKSWRWLPSTCSLRTHHTRHRAWDQIVFLF